MNEKQAAEALALAAAEALDVLCLLGGAPILLDEAVRAREDLAGALDNYREARTADAARSKALEALGAWALASLN